MLSGWAQVDHIPPLEPGTVHVWCAGRDAPAGNEGAALLAPEEQARADRFVQDRDRRRYIARHVFLRRLLSLYTRIPPPSLRFEHGPWGKPRLAEHQRGDLSFSLSHSDGIVLCAVGRGGELGVDVERIRPIADLGPVAADQFTAQERGFVESCPEPLRTRRFYVCWTRKEAWIKALGLGMQVPLQSFEVVGAGQAAAGGESPGLPVVQLVTDSRHPDPSGASDWRLHDLEPESDVVGALAVTGLQRVQTFHYMG